MERLVTNGHMVNSKKYTPMGRQQKKCVKMVNMTELGHIRNRLQQEDAAVAAVASQVSSMCQIL